MFNNKKKILVLDTESTCFAKDDEDEMLPTEIIQIGWCFLDTETLQISDPESIIVKTQIKISEYCTNLTGITGKMVSKGMPFEDACKNLIRKAGSRSRCLASWGDETKAFLNPEDRDWDNDWEFTYPFNDATLDVQMLAALFTDISINCNLKIATEQLCGEFIGTEHNAKWDAYNTARILRTLIPRGVQMKYVQELINSYVEDINKEI